MDSKLSRREMLVGAGALLGCFAVGGVGAAFADEGSYVRPPGGQDQARLRALCLKCDRCRSACPRKVIATVDPGSSLLDMRTPRIDFHLGFCDYCGVCQQVCPTQALAPGFDPAREALGVARLNPSKCLAYSTKCERCKDSCPYGALSFDERSRPVINEGLCNGCGRCVSVCQSNVAASYSGRERALEVCVLGGDA